MEKQKSNLPKFYHKISSFLTILVLMAYKVAAETIEENSVPQTFKIEGKIIFPSLENEINWATTTRVLVDGGEYLGFLRNDGSFVVNNIPSGSYMIEFVHPSYMFEAARVDITSKGKFRARRVNNVQTSAVSVLPYPLKIRAKGQIPYFHQREQWRITDFLFNPMVLMMVLPLFLIMVLPKLVNTNDPETQKEMQQQMNLLKPNQQMPEISEMFTSLFGGGGSAKKTAAKKAVKRR